MVPGDANAEQRPYRDDAKARLGQLDSYLKRPLRHVARDVTTGQLGVTRDHEGDGEERDRKDSASRGGPEAHDDGPQHDDSHERGGDDRA